MIMLLRRQCRSHRHYRRRYMAEMLAGCARQYKAPVTYHAGHYWRHYQAFAILRRHAPATLYARLYKASPPSARLYRTPVLFMFDMIRDMISPHEHQPPTALILIYARREYRYCLAAAATLAFRRHTLLWPPPLRASEHFFGNFFHVAHHHAISLHY